MLFQIKAPDTFKPLNLLRVSIPRFPSLRPQPVWTLCKLWSTLEPLEGNCDDLVAAIRAIRTHCSLQDVIDIKRLQWKCYMDYAWHCCIFSSACCIY
jgi:hypothetical protein